MTQSAVGTKNPFAAIAGTAGTRFSWTKADKSGGPLSARGPPSTGQLAASGCYHGRFHRGALPPSLVSLRAVEEDAHKKNRPPFGGRFSYRTSQNGAC
jgi:hypothetical protein